MAIYYDIKDDLEKYPEAWAYIIWSKRGPGKTYSTLRYCVENNVKFIFMKRTIDDVNLMCSRMEETSLDSDEDLSPFAPLNRDYGYNIYPFIISSKGLAAFYHGQINDKGKLEPVGEILGFILAVSAVSRFKGFSMDMADIMIFDEFIPKPWERVNRKEGDAVLDMYMTVSRDRLKRGRSELKLICLANATSLNNPMFNILHITDIAAEMDMLDREYTYLEDGTMLHYIKGDFDIEEGSERKVSGIEKRMEGTAWGIMAFGGHFGYNDFTSIGKVPLKGYTPVCTVQYEKDYFYIYIKEGKYYMTKSRHNSTNIYNLNKENDQKRFYYDKVIDLREACINGCMTFETFTMYDLIVNYKKYYSV